MGIHVGNVIICPTTVQNPYKWREFGEMRKTKLRQYRDGELEFGWQAWYAPTGGGARKLEGSFEVDWDSLSAR